MSLPEWLVERAALDEVPPGSRERIERADPRELSERVAALRAKNDTELARHPAGPAVAQIEARVAAGRRTAEQQRRRRLGWLGLAAGAATVLLVARFTVVGEPPGNPTTQVAQVTDDRPPGDGPDEITRRKGGPPRLVAFRLAGREVERLEQDAMVHAGDVIQLRYNAAGGSHGVIASLDGAGVVTLHYPLHEDAPPQATAVSPEPTALPTAYALDDAPGFERFFFVTADGPVDVQRTLAALRSLARRDDSATARLELPAGLRQWSLRLRKPETSPNHESP